MKKLVHTTNNAYDMMLLVKDGKVIGAWDYDRSQFDVATSAGIQDWEETYPSEDAIEDYGKIVQDK